MENYFFSHLSALIHCWFSLISGLEQKASMTFRRSFSINSSQLRASQGAPRRIKDSWKTPLSCRGKNRNLSICDVCNNPGEWVQLSGFDKWKCSPCSWISTLNFTCAQKVQAGEPPSCSESQMSQSRVKNHPAKEFVLPAPAPAGGILQLPGATSSQIPKIRSCKNSFPSSNPPIPLHPPWNEGTGFCSG